MKRLETARSLIYSGAQLRPRIREERIFMPYYVGIDIGTSGTRAIVIDETGKVLGSGTAGHTCQTPQPLWSEQSPEEWWAAVKIAVPAAISAARVKPDEIKGV